MKYRLLWLYDALDNLAASMLYARRVGRDPYAITRAMAQIDADMERDPATLGESRSGNRRVYIVNPVTVFFEVHEEERVVAVTAVRYHRRER
jgi:plasmid stabilization system protein ParE